MKFYVAIFFVACHVYVETLRFEDANSRDLPPLNVCGRSRSPNSYPWLVYIPLESKHQEQDGRCAGTLISDQYVIGSGSCMHFNVTKVRLAADKGETLEVQVENQLVYEGDPILLYKLAKKITYSDHVRPICLPFSNFKRAKLGDTLVSSGWGLTSATSNNYAKRMKNVFDTLVDVEECGGDEDDNLLCLKVQANSADRACNGDEGSPIMFKDQNQWVMEGVLAWTFQSDFTPCAVKEPSYGPQITEDILQWIVDNAKS